MTLVLSMNPFCEHEGDAPLPQYQPIWESEHCSKSCVSSPSPPEGATEELAEEPHCRRTPDHVTMSRIAYFKRKFVEDEEPHLSFRSYCQSVAPALEERAHVLRLSLEKMRFIDDPEAFLRRSVLINNLLRRIRTEILLQSEWCLPPGPAPTAAAACIPPPAQVGSNHPLGPQSLRPCFAAPGPYRKRFRLVRGEAPECIPACCCFYAAGRYLHFPFSVYEGAAPHPSSSPSSSSSSSSPTSFPQLLPVDDGDGDGEPHSLCPGLDLTEAAMAATAAARALDSKEPQRSRLRERTGAWEGERGHGGGTSEDRPLRERERERGRERDRERERARERGAGGGGGGDETLSGVAGSHARWSLDAMETGLHGALAWSQVGRK